MLGIATGGTAGRHDLHHIVVARVGNGGRLPIAAADTVPGLETLAGASGLQEHIPLVEGVIQRAQKLIPGTMVAELALEPLHTAVQTGGFLADEDIVVDTFCLNGHRKHEEQEEGKKQLLEAVHLHHRLQNRFGGFHAVHGGGHDAAGVTGTLTGGVEAQKLGLSVGTPEGEGAGYAGGIMSAAVDGMEAAEAVLKAMM